MSTDNMDHMVHLPEIAAADVSVLEMKEATYKGSWKAAGGRSAWFMFRRNMDRLLNMCAARDFNLDMHKLIPSGGASLSPEDFKKLQDALRAEDLFKLIEADPSGNDGTVLACLRDLRRYALLVEAEMVSRGVVQIERGRGDLKKNLLEGFKLPPGLVQNTQLLSTSLSQQMLVGAVKNSEPSLVSADLSKVEAAMGAQGLLTIPDEEIKSAIRYLRPGTLSDSLAEMLLPKVRQTLDEGGDYYSALAIALGDSRPSVKSDMLARSYGTVVLSPRFPVPDPEPEPEVEITPIRQIMRDIRTELSYEDWELRSIERVAHYAFPELGDGVRQDLTKKARATREGGGVYGRVAEVSGRTESEVQDLVLGRLYAAPDGDYNSDYDRDEHRRMTQAVSHALNCNSIDSALGCPDHILAELLAPHVIQYLRGETSGQLLEAGWTIGPHGQAIRPTNTLYGSDVAALGVTGDKLDPSVPGTPADGGHHGPSCGCGETIEDRPKVPRIEPRPEITALYITIRDMYNSARLTRDFWYSLDIRNSTNEVVANLVVRDAGGCLEASLNQGFTGVTFDFSEKNLQHHLAHLADYLDK